jgi:hypothetical protein
MFNGTLRSRIASMALGTTFVIAGCTVGTVGDGQVKSETRDTAAFSRIDVSGGISLVARIGPAEPIVVSAQEDLLKMIATDVENGTLRIHGTRAYYSSEPIEVTVVTPTLDSIAMSGGSHGQIDGLSAETIVFDVNGGSVLTASGDAGSVALDASGGSRADLGELATKTVVLDLSGGSQSTVRASGRVDGSASGGSRATVIGGALLHVDTSGGAAVVQE